jgi:hypothetical protein
MAAFLLEDSSIDEVRHESPTKGGGKSPALLDAEPSLSCFRIYRTLTSVFICVGYFMKEGFEMKRVVLLAAVAVCSVLGLLTAEFAAAADAPAASGPTDIVVGGKPLKGEVTKTLKGRVWSQWADNPDGELLFGIQYWNTGEPASGTPAGRSSTDLDVKPPDPLFVCCAWGFTGGTDRNNPYAGWYHAATTVRLAVKDKALMDQIIKASQELVAMEVSLDGRTITGFKLIK